jgi:hypothetical protein
VIQLQHVAESRRTKSDIEKDNSRCDFSWLIEWMSSIQPQFLQTLELGIQFHTLEDLAHFCWPDVDRILASFPVFEALQFSANDEWLGSDYGELMAAVNIYANEHLPLLKSKGVVVSVRPVNWRRDNEIWDSEEQRRKAKAW